jgi:hypothetical protein
MKPGRRNSGRPKPSSSFLSYVRPAGWGVLLALLWIAVAPAAEPNANPVARFSGLDKITARLTEFDVYINETVQFGSLQITPRACYTAPPNEPPHTLAFVEIDRVDLKADATRLFTGWMFAQSPGLNAVDDPLYDVWLVGCKTQTNLPPPTAINPVPGPVKPPRDTAGEAKPASPHAPAPPVPAPRQVDNGSIITLLNPAPAAQTPE